MSAQVAQSAGDNHGGEQHISGHYYHRQLYNPLPKAASKDRPEQETENREHDRDHHLSVPVSDHSLPDGMGHELFHRAVGGGQRIKSFLPCGLGMVDEVFRRIGHGKRFRDDEVGRGKTEQDENQQLAEPAVYRPFE